MLWGLDVQGGMYKGFSDDGSVIIPRQSQVKLFFQSDAKTVSDFMEALHDSGFACVQRVNGNVVPAPRLRVRVWKEAE